MYVCIEYTLRMLSVLLVQTLKIHIYFKKFHLLRNLSYKIDSAGTPQTHIWKVSTVQVIWGLAYLQTSRHLATRHTKKRQRQNLRSRDRNRATKSEIKTHIRNVLKSISSGDIAAADEQFRVVAKKAGLLLFELIGH